MVYSAMGREKATGGRDEVPPEAVAQEGWINGHWG